MSSVNKVIIIGNLGADPEVRDAGGTRLANLRVATSERWQDSAGEWQERTEWHRITCWRYLAERAEKYLAKGKQVYVEGKIQTRSWEDRDGETKYMTEIVARDLQVLGPRERDDGRDNPPF